MNIHHHASSPKQIKGKPESNDEGTRNLRDASKSQVIYVCYGFLCPSPRKKINFIFADFYRCLGTDILMRAHA